MRDDDKRQLAAAFTLVSTLGLSMVANIVAGLLLGRLADNYFGTRWWTVAGIVTGMIAGLWSVYKRIMAESSNKGKGNT